MTTPETQGKVSPESMRKTASSAVKTPAAAKPAAPCITGNHAERNRLKPCTGAPVDVRNELKFEVKKEIPVY
jgi:hypothetical protein